MIRRHFFAFPLAASALQPAVRVRITVLKRSVQKEFEKYSWGPIPFCDRVKEGQRFMVAGASRVPEGMCPSAWEQIHKTVCSIRDEGPERTVACCTDGFRPVFFLLERLP